MTSVKRRGQESNLRPSGSEPDATTNSCCPGSINAPPANRTLTSAGQSRTAAPAVGECERRESNPSSSGWKPDILPLNYTRNFKRKERESNHRPQGYEPCELPLLYPAERPARIELASSAWQADGFPLHHGRLLNYQVVKDQSTVRESNSALPVKSRVLHQKALPPWS